MQSASTQSGTNKDWQSNVSEIIREQIAKVAREDSKVLAPLTDNLVLLDSGLDSLGFAVLIERLEETLGINPFIGVGLLPVTFSDFVKAYENCAR